MILILSSSVSGVLVVTFFQKILVFQQTSSEMQGPSETYFPKEPLLALRKLV